MKSIDELTTIAKLQELIGVFVRTRGWWKFHTPRNLAESISIEAAELLAEFQWDNQFDNPLDLTKVRHELADVLIYCFRMANAIDCDVAEIITAKLAINAKKYPAELKK